MAVVLTVEKRTEIGKRRLKALRKKGRVPGIVYGRDMKESVLISASELDVKHILKAHDQVVELAGLDELQQRNALIKEVQNDTLSNRILHVDFNIFKADEEITLSVSLQLKGEAVGVREDNGVLSQDLHEIEVRCRLDQVPHAIVVDVSELQVNEGLHVKDLLLPEGVTAEADAEAMVVIVQPPREEEEEVPAAEEAEETSSEPEVLTERKDAAGSEA